ncbi:MAG: methyltransferase domain-containing protein [Candidatus Thioglobus autotrophicus]|nr:methyltransferase domain-containing protein [Candidatus Thioglobus autotrophicus]
MKTFLHVGCGPQNKSSCLGFNNDNWKEIRFDIDKNVNPDIVGTLTDMKLVETGSVDAVYSSHNIEHIFPHEVPIALREFYRVLKEDGIVVITCPDLQSAGEAVTQDKLFKTLYEGHDGPVTAFDVLFGHRETTADGNVFMIHKGGFTYSLLDKAFYEAGFKARVGGRRPEACDLFLVAFKQKKSDEEIKKIAIPFLPEPKF